MPKLTVNGVDLNVVDRGSGRPILFVHGFGLDHRMWQSQLAAFQETHRVIAPDLRGFGGSGVTPGTVTMEQFADDVLALLDALGVEGPVCYCGLSMGGYIAWPFLRNFASRVDSLVLCDTRAIPDTSTAAERRLMLADAVLQYGSQAAVEVFLPLLFPSSEPREAVDAVRSMIAEADPEGIAAALRGMAERPDSTDLLAQIDVPTLVICGSEDRITPPADVRAMADGIPQARFVELPGAGHVPTLEQPDVVNDLLREFLSARG